MTVRSRFFVVSVLMLALLALVVEGRAYANGRVVRFVRQVAGPYEIALGTIPPTPAPGALHLTMTVANASSKSYVLDAEIAVTGKSPESDSSGLGPLSATHNPEDPTFYDINTTVDREGTWLFTVAVSSDLGEASADFPIEVRKANPLAGIATLLLLVALLTIIGLSAWTYLRDWGKTRKRKKRGRS